MQGYIQSNKPFIKHTKNDFHKLEMKVATQIEK